MRLIDGEHLRKWILARWEEIDPASQYPLKAAEILAQIERECQYPPVTVPTAEPTLYGYKIEHLAYIATVMEKEGVTAEYVVRTFDDIGRVVKMLIEEAQAKVEEVLNERFN